MFNRASAKTKEPLNLTTPGGAVTKPRYPKGRQYGPHREWSPEEVEYLRQNYRTLGRMTCAERLKRSINAVAYQACAMNISKRHDGRYTARHSEKVMAAQDVVIASAPADCAPLPPAVIASDFIRPVPLSRLMSGKA